MTEIVGVRFRSAGKVYYFDPSGLTIPAGTDVIVETANGLEFGECVGANEFVDDDKVVQPLRHVIRIATDEDRRTLATNSENEKRALEICQQKADELKLDMKVVEVEYAFDGTKVLFYFISEGRVDFRELVKELAAIFHMRIELRQIGVRDEAKMLGGLGICGREFCCSGYMHEFHPVSIKMAKEQNLSLNPTKISGTCGRLMCCLKYEQEAYSSLLKTTPKMGSLVMTPDGEGTIIDIGLLRGRLKVLLTNSDQGETVTKFYNVDDVKVLRSGKARPPKQN